MIVVLYCISRLFKDRFRCVIEFVHPKAVTDSDNDKALDYMYQMSIYFILISPTAFVTI